MVAVVAREEEGDAEGAEAAVLRVGLLVVADGADELLHRDGLLELVQIPLRRQTGCCGCGGGWGVEE